MGRYYFNKKTEVDDLKKVKIYWLKKHGYLDGRKLGEIEWNNSFTDNKNSIGIIVSTMDEENYACFKYSQTDINTGEKKAFDYRVKLVTTKCNYGGKRYWFICPLVKNGIPCNRRVGVLYKDGDYFGCRHCYDLTYSSKNENRKYMNHPEFRTLILSNKIDELMGKIKRPYYAGKPTRKQRKLETIHKEIQKIDSRSKPNKTQKFY